jgi:hypothetical protein
MNPLQKIKYWYRWIFEPQFLAGERAEQHFEKLSEMKGYILEKIPQDKNNFDKYKNNSENHIKRGDFLVRNLKNLEVEVKCFTKRKYEATREFPAVECYVIAYSHIKRHAEMVNITGEPVVFAIFERNGREVLENSLRMIPLKELTGRRKDGIFYDKQIKCVSVPLNTMYPNFSYFEQYKLEINKTNTSDYSRYQKPRNF